VSTAWKIFVVLMAIALVVFGIWVVWRVSGVIDHLHDLHEWLERIWERLGPGDPPIGPPPPPPPKLW
jgi:hypothetical protein